jgi:hypothetical protein
MTAFLPALPAVRSGVLYHVWLWVLAVRVTVLGKVSSVRHSATHKIESEHVVMILGYGSMTLIHSNELITVAYMAVCVLHWRHTPRG